MRIFLSFLLLVQLTASQEIDNQSYNPCEDPLLKLARVKGIKAVPLKDIRKFRKALRKCKLSQEDGEKKVAEISNISIDDRNTYLGDLKNYLSKYSSVEKWREKLLSIYNQDGDQVWLPTSISPSKSV